MFRRGYYTGYGGYGGWNSPNYGQQAPYQQGQFGGYQNAPQQAQQMNSQMEQAPALQVPWVNGEVGAQAYLVPPNSTALLMDSDNPIFYIKTSDMSGKATIQAFKYEELKQAQVSVPASNSYVTKEEFETFKASILENKEKKEGETL